MGQQSIRQAARRAALDAQAQRRRERAERDKRIEAIALDVVAALAEREASVAQCETRAGEALRMLTVGEGLTLREAVEWCGGQEQLTVREATRLRTLEPAEPTEPDGHVGNGSTGDGPGGDGGNVEGRGALSAPAAPSGADAPESSGSPASPAGGRA